MASLVAPLACGISGAASGSAAFYLQGTSTIAPVYSDAEGQTAVTSHTLDSNGGITRYVEARVDVVVMDVNGATVRTFTWGLDARDARVENLYWTGPDSTGQIVAGGRITVDTALSRLGESLGTTDGYVNVNGTALTLSNALSNGARVFNVKNYGADGDGVADDGPAQQLAWNAAANAGGGIVYYPAGTYLTTTAVVMPSSVGKVTYLGESASGTTIKQANATTCWSLGTSNSNMIMGLAFAPSSASNTGTLVAIGDTARATFVSCTFSALNGTTFALTASGNSRINCSSCTIAQAGASSRIASGNGAYLRLEGCDVSTSGGDLVSFSDSVFVMSVGTNWALGSAISAGTTYIYNNANSIFQVVGGEINVAFTSGTVTVANAGVLIYSGTHQRSAGATVAAASSSAELYEAGTLFSRAADPADAYPPAISGIGLPVRGHSSARENRSFTSTSGSATSYTPTIGHRLHEVTSSGASMAINNPSTTMPTGWPLVILYKNTSGGNITPTFGTAYTFTTAVGIVNNGQTGVYYFIPRCSSITSDLVNISPQAAGGYVI